MSARAVEAVSLVVMALAVLVGGRAFLVQIAQFHGVAIAVLGVLGMLVVYAFRRNYLRGDPLARLRAGRDAAFLAAVASAIAFTAAPARWSLGAAVVAVEVALAVELLVRVVPTSPLHPKDR